MSKLKSAGRGALKARNNRSNIVIGTLATSSLAAILVAGIVSATTNEIIDNIEVAVESSCTLSRTGGSGDYSVTMVNGTVNSNIGSSTLDITCNDANGWRLMAKGYDSTTEENSTVLTNANVDGSTIPTGTATSGPTSNWSMKLNTSATNAIFDNGFTNNTFHAVPEESTRIVYSEEASTGTSLTTTYQVYISPSQVAGVYKGGVKYTLEHPAEEPICGAIMPMQGITESYISSMTPETQVQMCDERDGKTYWVAKLADYQVWMTQNLDLVLDPSVTLTPEDSDISYGRTWTPSIATQTHQYKEINGTIHNTGIDNALWNTTDTTFGYNYAPHSYRPASDPAAGTSGDYGNDGETYFSPVFMKNGTTMQSWKTEAECVAGGNAQSDCQHWNVGTFYSWYAATAGTGNASVSTVTHASDSICPKGWQLPAASSWHNDFQMLVNGGMTASNMTGAPYYFLRAGVYDGDYGAVGYAGYYGAYWSDMSASNTGGAASLSFDSGDIYPADDGGRYYGMGVRCLAEGRPPK